MFRLLCVKLTNVCRMCRDLLSLTNVCRCMSKFATVLANFDSFGKFIRQMPLSNLSKMLPKFANILQTLERTFAIFLNVEFRRSYFQRQLPLPLTCSPASGGGVRGRGVPCGRLRPAPPAAGRSGGSAEAPTQHFCSVATRVPDSCTAHFFTA